MSHPIPLGLTTDAASEAKLNEICQPCSEIVRQVSALENSCSKDEESPMIALVNHHESSDALIMSAHNGCHLCTLLLGELEGSFLEDLQALEVESGIREKQADEQSRPCYQIKISGYLEKSRLGTKRKALKTAAISIKRAVFEWHGIERQTWIDVVLPHQVTRHEVTGHPEGNVHVWTYSTARLFVNYHFGASKPPLELCSRETVFTDNDRGNADGFLSRAFRYSASPKPISLNGVAILI